MIRWRNFKLPKMPGMNKSPGSLDSKAYMNKVLSQDFNSLIGYWILNEESGLIANDKSSKNNDGDYSSGINYGATGIGDGNFAIEVDGKDTHVKIGSSQFAGDWNGDVFSMITWGKVDDISRWTDNTTYRYLMHIRSAADPTYYAVMGKNNSNNQLEWRRRSGGAIVSKTFEFTPSGTLDWFCMGMTCDINSERISFYLYDSQNGWKKVDTINSAQLTAWGSNDPNDGATVIGAGSVTLQEWIGYLAHGAIWAGVEFTDSQMEEVMTL